MANVARDVAGVIAGEAGGRTRAQRFADMKAIASVISNRVAATRETVQSVISAPRQFDAYGKAYPPGTKALRAMAQEAWDEVQATGPVHPGLYYATPAAVNNLPAGLSPVTETTAHNYFTDPQERSIRTAVGYRAPDLSALGAPVSIGPNINRVGAVPSFGGLTTPGPGLGALAPHGLIGTSALSKYDQTGLTAGVSRAINAVAKNPAAQNISVNSGYRDPVKNAAVGGAKRSQHMLGNAVDLDVSGLTDAQKTSVLDTAVENGVKGVGIYASGNTIHVDARKSPALWSNSYKGIPVSQAPAWAQPTLDGMFQAGAFDVTPRTTAPTPTARPALAAAMDAHTRTRSPAPAGTPAVNAPALSKAMASAGISTPNGMTAAAVANTRSPSSVPSSPSRPALSAAVDAHKAATATPTTASAGGYTRARSPGPVSSAPPSYAATPANVSRPAITGVAPQSTFAGTTPSPIRDPRDMQNVTGPKITGMQRLAPTAMPSALAAAVAAQQAITAPVAPVVSPVSRPKVSVPVAPHPVQRVAPQAVTGVERVTTPQAPRYSPSDIYSGQVGSAVSSSGNVVGRDAFGNTTVTNKFGVTTGMTPAGKQTAYSKAGQFGFGSFGPKTKSVMGSLTGAALGSMVAGPVGGIIGGMLGKNIAAGISPLGAGTMGMLAGKASGSFPSAPAQAVGTKANPGGGSSKSNRSEASMKSMSPGAAKSISKGTNGLF